MSTFKQLIEKELAGKIKNNSQEAMLLIAVRGKKELLQGTIELRGNEAFDEETLASLDYAADELAEQIIDEMLEDGDPKRASLRERIKVGSVSGLRTKGGQFIAALKLRSLLNIVLQKYIKERMGQAGRLNYQTGRLANSAEVESLADVPGSDKVSLMFSYMTYPYATFEEGGRQHAAGREPSDLIDIAIQDALEDILNNSSLKRIETVFGGSL